jgi:hypothetical protein
LGRIFRLRKFHGFAASRVHGSDRSGRRQGTLTLTGPYLVLVISQTHLYIAMVAGTNAIALLLRPGLPDFS